MTAFTPVDRASSTPLSAHAAQTVTSSKRGIRIAVAAALLVALFVAWKLFHTPAAPPAPPPATLTVATPLQRSVTEWDDYVGRFAPSQTVQIRPRVSGAVTRIAFKDGDIVRKGDLLFVIDPRPFAASLAEARAGVASARSALALARADLGRAQRLIADEAVSAGEVDSLRARVQAAQAALAGAEARQQARGLEVEFTQVRAPISGRISDRRVDIGNLVAGGVGGEATLLTTVNALDPIYFTFDGSEALFLKAQRQRQSGAAIPPVEIRLQDETGYRWKGRLDFTDNGLDTRSGTIRARAVLSNKDLFLTPGLFGNMRLANAKPHQALLVPDSAVQTDQARKTVLVIGEGDTVEVKAVVLGPVIEGLRIIRSGVLPTDRVVIAGAQNAMPGAKAVAQAGRIEPTVIAASTPVSAPIAAQATFAR